MNDDDNFGLAAHNRDTVEPTLENLQQLLICMYVVSDQLASYGWGSDASRDEYLDAVLNAVEGKPFVPFQLPFPQDVSGHDWFPMSTAPKNVEIEVRTNSVYGLPSLDMKCKWHPDGDFCVDELREPIQWRTIRD